MEIPLTIKETQEGLFEGRFSCVELVQTYLKQIGKTKDLNIYLTIAGSALDEAKQKDDLIKESGREILKTHPLIGVSVAHKDIFLTKGIKTTAASKVLQDYIPQYSSSVVEKLEASGCITLGKLNCDAWAHGSSGENSDFGPTLNPWNKEYVPGGSSSGSGASIGANLALVATATDTCGSTRLPANFNYSVGLKPTYGAISRYGVIAMASSLDTVGHITRSVADSKKIFDVVKGPDGKDSNVIGGKFERRQKGKYRIGIPKEFFQEGLDNEVKANIKNAIDLFKKEGVDFVDVGLPNTKYAIDVYYIIQPAEVSSNLGRFDGVRYGEDRNKFGREAKRRIMLGTYVLSHGYYDEYYLKAMKVRSLIAKEVDEVFEKVDALIAPVAPTPPFRLGEKVNDPLAMYLTDIFAATANLTGIPSLALPFGFSNAGLPFGFQLMGSRFSEDSLFDLGEMFERISGYQPKVGSGL